MDPTQVDRVVSLLRHAQHLCVSSGAGMSAESGVATFRDAQGLWSRFNPMDVATPQAFDRDPLKVWEWYRWRRGELAKRRPHAGHHVLAAWEQRLARVTIITQNVDGLHHRAGSRNVIELHGRLDSARCVACPYEVRGLQDLGPDPRCADCGERMRPGVVWFGEALPDHALAQAQEEARMCDLFLLIGTSGVVYPAAGLADTAVFRGVPLVEINPEQTPFSEHATCKLAFPCGAALKAIEECWSGRPMATPTGT